MARTTIDFTGSNGAAWPSPFVQKTSSSGSSASIQSNRGRIVLPNLGDYGAIHAMGFTPDSNNYTISVDFVVLQITTEQYQRVTWRNVADGSDGRCYVFEWGIDPSNASFISLYSQDSSWQQTNLYGTGYTVAVNDVIHLKVQQVGTTLRAKHWKNSENEPGTWADYNGTPGTSYTTGPVWLVAQGGATAPGTTRNKDFDNFVIETAIIPLAPANIAASAIPLTVAAPPSAVTLVPQTLALSPGTLTVSAPAGGVSVTLEPQILRLLTPGSILVNDASGNQTLPEGSTFNVKTQYGAAGNGSTNDTTAIQNALDAAAAAASASAASVVYFPNGTYMISAALTVGSNVIMRGEATATAIIKNTRSRADTEYTDMLGPESGASRSNIIVERLTWHQEGEYYDTQAGYNRSNALCISANWTTNMVVQDCRFEDTATICVWTDSAGAAQPTNQLKILRNYVARSNGDAFSFFGQLYDAIVQDNEIHDTADEAIAFQATSSSAYPSRILCRGNIIRDCIRRSHLIGGEYATPNGINVHGADNAIVENNSIDTVFGSCIRSGFGARKATNVIIRNNYCAGAGANGGTGVVPAYGIWLIGNDHCYGYDHSFGTNGAGNIGAYQQPGYEDTDTLGFAPVYPGTPPTNPTNTAPNPVAGDPIVDDGGDPLIITGGMTISLEGEPVEQFISLSPITLTSTAVVLTTTGGSIAIALSPLTITLTLAPIGPATAGSPQSLDLAPNVLTLLLPQLEIPITGGPPEPPVAAGAFGMPTVYTTSIPPQFLQDIIFGPIVRRRRRVDIYLDDGETLWFKDAPLIDGNVSVDMSRAERRNVDLVLDNSNRYLDHHPDGFWYDNVLKVYHGVETDDAIWETQIGEFMIDSISEPHFPYQVSVRGRDYAKKLLLDEFATATAFDKGQEVAQVVRTIAENGGIRPDRMILDDDGATLGIVTTFERKTKRWEAIGKIADAHSLEVFFDRFGYLVLRPYRDPQISPLVFTFLTGATGNLANYDKESNDAWLKNHVVVSGAATGNSIPVFAEATNTNPASATSVDRIGRRTFTEESAFITTVAQAKARADQLLAVSGLESYNIDLGAIVAPWLEEGNAIEFIDPRPVMAQPTRYLLTSFDIPLQLGTMNVKGKRLTIVTSTGSERKPPGYGVTYPPTVNPPTPGVENVAPIVTQEPTNTAVQSGSMFYFTAAASGEPAPTVQWQVSTESTSGPWNDIPGATSTTLSGVASDAANGNYYRARFLNIVGSALTNAVQLTVTTVSVPTTIGRARLAWYHFDYNNPPSDAVINAWAPQIALAVLHPRMTATRNKIKAANPNCRVLAAKSLWTVVSSETTAPFSTAVSYSQAQTNSWIAQDNTP